MFVRRRTGELFFACPDCGCAWQSVPVAGVVDIIEGPESYAPDGWMVATQEEITAGGLATLIRRLAPFDESVFDRMAGFARANAQAAAADERRDGLR